MDIRIPARLEGDIWGITTYYNPAGYSNKLQNFRRFREGLRLQGLPLAVVELAFGDKKFELGADDADILVQKRTETILWHKERMLNIALSALPPACDKFVWLDADILFFDSGWVDKTASLLQDYAIVQPFSHAARFGRGVSQPGKSDLLRIKVDHPDYHGVIYNLRQPAPAYKFMNSGLAWAARREIFSRHGFYDKLILGTGDRFMLGAFLGFRFRDDHERFTGSMMTDQDRWIEAVFGMTSGSVACQQGLIGHLFHGTIRQRNYHKRTHILRKHAFDPLSDIRTDNEGLWTWASDKEELHREIREYFQERREEDDDPWILQIRDMARRKLADLWIGLRSNERNRAK